MDKVSDWSREQLKHARKAVLEKSLGIQNEIFLGRWGEVIGKFFGLEKRDRWLVVKLSIGTLIFPVDSFEAKIIGEKLREAAVGQVVGILRTDSVERPIVVRIVESNENRSIHQQKAPLDYQKNLQGI